MELKHLATLDNSMQTQMLCDLLSNEGIETIVKNQVLTSVIPGFQEEVYVLSDDYEQALRLMRKAFPYLGY